MSHRQPGTGSPPVGDLVGLVRPWVHQLVLLAARSWAPVDELRRRVRRSVSSFPAPNLPSGVTLRRPGSPAGLAAAGVCVLAGVVLAGAGLWLVPRAAPAASPPAGRGGHAAGVPPESVPTAAAAPSPAVLRVPAIGVQAVVESVGRDGDGNMATPSTPEDVGWYRYGPAPGDPGDAVIDGHLDWTNGPAVFWRLGQLRPGDAIYVDLPGGVTRMFEVTRLTTVPYDSHPSGLFEAAGDPRLSLITCAGPYDLVHSTYAQRLIVDAALVAGSGGPGIATRG